MMLKPSAQVQKLHKANSKTNGTRYTTAFIATGSVDRSSFQQMTLREAQLLTLNVLKQVMEEKLDQHNVQLAQVCLLSLSCSVQYSLIDDDR